VHIYNFAVEINVSDASEYLAKKPGAAVVTIVRILTYKFAVMVVRIKGIMRYMLNYFIVMIVFAKTIVICCFMGNLL
jgi:hypothetical protein